MDLKTFQRFDLHAASVITCVTAQNSLVVTHVEPFSRYSVGQQNEAVCSYFVIPVLKFGMLHSSAIVDVGKGPGIAIAACNDATHSHKGTGCTLGTAVMAALVLGLPLADSVIQAKVYVRQALLQAVACG